MREYDVHLRIRNLRSPGSYVLRLTLKDGRTASSTFPRNEIPIGQNDGASLGNALHRALGKNLNLLEERLTLAAAAYSWTTIFLELEDPKLTALPWEAISASQYFARWHERLHVVRYRTRPVDRLVTPVELPIDLVVARGAQAGTDGQVKVHAPEVACDAFKYFRTTRIEGPGVAQRFRLLASAVPIDILHVAAHVRPSIGGPSLESLSLDLCSGEPLLNPSNLVRLLSRCAARLLVLDVPEAEPARRLAHDLLVMGGPPVLVVPHGPLRDELISRIYIGIVHATPLDQLFFQTRHLEPASTLFLPEAASEALNPQAAATKVAEQARSLERTALRLEKALPLRRSAIAQVRERLAGLNRQAYDWEHESGGTVPLTRITADLSAEAERVEAVQEEVRRVINVWLEYLGAEWSRWTPLQPARKYDLCIQIGRPRKENLVEAPRFLPETLIQASDDKGVELEVAIFTSDFEIATTRAKLALPPTPRSSEILRIAFGAPSTPRAGRIRIGVYRHRYLLQTIVLDIAVDLEEGPTRRPAVKATLDFALEGDFVAFEEREERRLNIVVNQDGGGTHSFHVLGTEIKDKFDIGEVELVNRVGESRAQLREIAGADEKLYNFDADNNGDIAKLIQHVGWLANFGYTLFDDLFSRRSDAFDKAVAGIPPRSIIQVAMTRSAKHVFPWALVYDKPLLRGDERLSFCEEFRRDIVQGGPAGFLTRNKCLSERCPHWDDELILCPSGFWGFRHRIEQPLTLVRDASGSESTASPQRIETGEPINLVLGVSLELKQLATHRRELSQIMRVQIDPRETREDIGKGLQRTDAAVIYLYCHGGRAGSDVWLGVGRRQRLFPTDLRTWKVSWPAQHPLVFINGCHTVDISPDDLLPFTTRLARCQAAGVLGTEIPVPETLARAFGRGLLGRLLSYPHPQVGEAVLAERIALLERCNVLGLAYTPYCPADLAVSVH